MSILSTELLNKQYCSENIDTQTKQNQVIAINNVTMDVLEGDFLGIMGKSGSGKTTLLKLLGSIEAPTSGNVYYNKINLNKLSLTDLMAYRRKNIGFVFQDFRLLENLSVKENIILPIILDDRIVNKEVEECVHDIANKMGIRSLFERYPYELSGGEKQRVAVCRALMNDPDIIFADEPTGNLDSKSAQTVINLLNMINQEMRKTIIMVTHDPMVASNCSRVLFLKDGYFLDEIKKNNNKDDFYSLIINKMKDL